MGLDLIEKLIGPWDVACQSCFKKWGMGKKQNALPLSGILSICMFNVLNEARKLIL